MASELEKKRFDDQYKTDNNPNLEDRVFGLKLSDGRNYGVSYSVILELLKQNTDLIYRTIEDSYSKEEVEEIATISLRGTADLSTPSPSNDGFWIVSEQGEYVNFGGVELVDDLGVITRVGGVYSIAQVPIELSSYAQNGGSTKTLKEVEDSVLGVKPVNLFNWGQKINHLPFDALASQNYAFNDLGIAVSGTFLIDINIVALRGKNIFFGFISLPTGQREFGTFLDSSRNTIAGYTPTFSQITGSDDSDGYRAYSLTHSNNLIPQNATFLRLQFRNGAGFIKSIYAGETPYKGISVPEINTTGTYRTLGIDIFKELTVDSTYTQKIELTRENNQIRLSRGSNDRIDFAFNFTNTKYRGKRRFFSIEIENNNETAVFVDVRTYNQVAGVFTTVSAGIFSIQNGFVCFPVNFETSHNYCRIFIRTSTSATESILLKRILISNEIISNESTLLQQDFSSEDYDTFFEGYSQNSIKFTVGSEIYRKRIDAQLPSFLSEVNNKTAYNYNSKMLPSTVYNVKVIDTRGFFLDNFNKGRYLTHVTSDGWMYFKQTRFVLERIRVEDFLESLIQHDLSGTDSSRITFLNLPSNQTNIQKQAEFDIQSPNWLMFDETKSNLFETIDNGGPAVIQPVSLEFENGSIFNFPHVYRANGDRIRSILKEPILGNPVSVRIRQSGTLLNELNIKQLSPTGFIFGKMKADQGSIIIEDPIDAVLNFKNGKEISVNISLSAGTYDFGLLIRRHGTQLVDGVVEVLANNIKIGEITLDVNSGNNVAELFEISQNLTLSNSITNLKFRAVCATEKNLSLAQFDSLPRWGQTSIGRFGTIVEYTNNPKRAGRLYFTEDNGISWRMVFDASLNQIYLNPSGGHLHGAHFDPYWNKLFLVGGDSDFAKGIFHCELSKLNSIDLIDWKVSEAMQSFYGTGFAEQHCSVYPMQKNVLFGSDCGPTGIYRMNRIDSDRLTDREPSAVIYDSGLITHVPNMYSKKDENSPVFITSHPGAENSLHPVFNMRTSLLHATFDGVTMPMIYKDVVKHVGFGNNVYQSVFHYNGKIIWFFYGDGRFENGYTLIIGDYKL